MRSQEHGSTAEERERNNVIRIVGELLEQRWIGRDDTAVGDEKSVAVGWSTHERAHRGSGTATGAVFDDDRLTDPFLQIATDDTRHGVRQAAGRIGHDEADALIGIRGLCVRCHRKDGCDCHGEWSPMHEKLH
jgi:hypothetical protein